MIHNIKSEKKAVKRAQKVCTSLTVCRKNKFSKIANLKTIMLLKKPKYVWILVHGFYSFKLQSCNLKLH